MNLARPSVVVPTLVLAAVAATSWLSLHAGASAPAIVPAPVDGKIEDAMHQIDAAVKALSKGITAETRDAAFAELEKLETALIAAKSQVPESAAKVDEKKRAAFVADYRKTLLETLKMACDAEAALADGKYKDAEKLINNKLGAQKSAGHSKYKESGQ